MSTSDDLDAIDRLLEPYQETDEQACRRIVVSARRWGKQYTLAKEYRRLRRLGVTVHIIDRKMKEFVAALEDEDAGEEA